MTTQTQTRRCIGSTRFGIEAHETPAADFPVQPSQKDGLGRMCHTHWRQYTNALRKAAVARKAEASTDAEPEVEIEAGVVLGSEAESVADPELSKAPRPRRAKATAEPEAAAEEADAA